jgi:hypothetical protein
MGTAIELKAELEGIKREAEAFAEVLENAGDTFDSDEMADMLRRLMRGDSCTAICTAFEIEDNV